MPSIADEIADKLLDRSVNLSRLEAGERRRILKILREMERNIELQLKDIDPTGIQTSTYRQIRLKKLLGEVREVTRTSFREASNGHSKLLGDLAVTEGNGTALTINATMGVDLVTAGLGEAHLRSVADNLLVQGAPAQEWWSRQAATVLQKFTDEMRSGVLIGDSLSDLIRRTQQIANVADRNAEALVRTSIQSVENASREAVFVANKDGFRGRQWIATLDNRTCPICAALSGNVWDFEGRNLEGGKPFPGPPPVHYNCRCILIALPKAFDDLREARGSKLRRQLDDLSAGKRKDIAGDVAVDMNFEQWLRTKSASAQKDILGQGRYKLWSEGKIKLSQLTNQDHRPLTLEQLRALF